MNLLAIDTSTDCASVGLWVNNKLHNQEQTAQRTHAQFILPMIENLLAEAQLSLTQLDALVYGQGPGSFTGLRIACSVVKGIAYAQDLPVYSVSSLAAIAYKVQKQIKNTAILSVLDARMGQLYWTYFTAKGTGTTEQVSAASDIHIDDEKPIILAGVGYEAYLEQLSATTRSKIIQCLTLYPHAEAMIQLVLAGKVAAVSAAEALPVYVRNQVTQGDARG